MNWITRFALVSLLAVAMTGCDNNPYPPGESYGNVQYRYLTEDPKSLDPTFSYTVDEAYVCDVIYPSFYRYHYLKQTPVAIELCLGAKEPTRTARADGGEEWTFTIRQDLRFQDDPCFPGGKGRAITAKDIVYSFQRMVDPKAEFPLANLFADKIVGWTDYAKGFARERKRYADPNYDRSLAGVQVDPKDPYTLHIRLTQQYPQLRYIMAMHFTTPQAREAVEKYGDEYRRHPVGCGPYMLTEYKRKQRLVLVKNPNGVKATYPAEGDPGDREAGLLADAGKPLPLSDKVVFNIIKEATSRWNLFRQGYLDGEALNSNNFQQAMGANGTLSPEMARSGILLRRAPQMAIYYLAFNLNDPVWGGRDDKHKKLRQAVSLSVDSQEFIDLAMQGNGLPAQWMLPPGLFGNDPTWKNPYRQVDLERAKQLLVEAGFPDGKDSRTGDRLVLHFDSTFITSLGRQQFGILQKQMERIGIKVEHRAVNGNQFQDRLHKLEHQFILYGWFADYPDPENFLFLLYSQNAAPGSPNYTQYKNPEFDRLFDRIRLMDDSPARRALLDQMRAMAVEDCAWIPLYHPVSVSLSYDWTRNVKAHPIANDFVQYRGVDYAKRARKQREWNPPVYWPLAVLVALIVAIVVPAVKVIQSRVNRRVRVGEGGDRT